MFLAFWLVTLHQTFLVFFWPWRFWIVLVKCVIKPSTFWACLRLSDDTVELHTCVLLIVSLQGYSGSSWFTAAYINLDHLLTGLHVIFLQCHVAILSSFSYCCLEVSHYILLTLVNRVIKLFLPKWEASPCVRISDFSCSFDYFHPVPSFWF